MSKVISVLSAVLLTAALAAAPAGAHLVRSPDAGDANAAAQKAQYVDLRSPDARDSGRVVVVPASLTAPAGDDGGTAWGTIAIIAGGALMLGVAGAGVAVGALRHHRRHTAVSA